jgi:hypothetical protein
MQKLGERIGLISKIGWWRRERLQIHRARNAPLPRQASPQRSPSAIPCPGLSITRRLSLPLRHDRFSLAHHWAAQPTVPGGRRACSSLGEVHCPSGALRMSRMAQVIEAAFIGGAPNLLSPCENKLASVMTETGPTLASMLDPDLIDSTVPPRHGAGSRRAAGTFESDKAGPAVQEAEPAFNWSGLAHVLGLHTLVAAGILGLTASS